MIDLHFEDVIFESSVMRFGLPYNSLQAQELVEDQMVEYANEIYFITDLWDEHQNDGTIIRRVEAEARWMKLIDRLRPGDFLLDHVTPAAGLQAILTGTLFTPGDVTLDTALYSLEARDATVLDLIWRWARITGNEVSWNSYARKVNFTETIGITRPHELRYGVNLRTIERHITPPEITRLYGFGKENLTIAALNGGVPYLENFTYYTGQGMTLEAAMQSYIKEDVINDSSIAEDTTLFGIMRRELAARATQKIEYKATAADLNTIVGAATDATYNVGDSLYVIDEPTGISQTARVTRTVKYPHKPELNEVEFSFVELLPPDNSSSNRDAISNGNWDLFVSRNDLTERRLRQGTSVLGRIQIRASEGAEWVVGYKFEGYAVGTGSITISAEDDSLDANIWEPVTIDFVDGERVEHSFTYGQKEIIAGLYTLVVRSASSGAAVGVDLDPGQTSLWVLAKNSVRQNPVLDTCQRFEYNGSKNGGAGTVQTFQVPDDVSEISFEITGSKAPNGGNDGTPGKGAKVSGKIAVVAGETFDIYVGGHNSLGNSNVGGWPNGGNGGSYSTNGTGGGGASFITRVGETIATAVAVAGAGGGMGGGGFGSAADGSGGDGGFYEGGDGTDHAWGIPDGGHGYGATQDAPGAGGGPVGGTWAEDGDTDGQGQGGDAFGSPGPGTLGVGSGGGGGGWHGGGGGRSEGNGAGGGSSWVDPAVYDLEFQDGANDDDGYVQICWANPAFIGGGAGGGAVGGGAGGSVPPPPTPPTTPTPGTIGSDPTPATGATTDYVDYTEDSDTAGDRFETNLNGGGTRYILTASTQSSRIETRSMQSNLHNMQRAGRLGAPFLTSIELQNYILDGSDIPHNTNGLQVAYVADAYLHDLTAMGMRGSGSSPPGETFGISLWHVLEGLLEDVTISGLNRDGVLVGATLLGLNDAENITVTDCSFNGAAYGFGVASWESKGINVFTRVNFQNCRKAVNHEQCLGSWSYIDCDFRNQRGSSGTGRPQVVMNGNLGSATLLIDEPIWDRTVNGAPNPFRVGVDTGGTYLGRPQLQDVDDVTVIIDGVTYNGHTNTPLVKIGPYW